MKLINKTPVYMFYPANTVDGQILRMSFNNYTAAWILLDIVNGLDQILYSV